MKNIFYAIYCVCMSFCVSTLVIASGDFVEDCGKSEQLSPPYIVILTPVVQSDKDINRCYGELEITRSHKSSMDAAKKFARSAVGNSYPFSPDAERHHKSQVKNGVQSLCPNLIKHGKKNIAVSKARLLANKSDGTQCVVESYAETPSLLQRVISYFQSDEDQKQQGDYPAKKIIPVSNEGHNLPRGGSVR